MPSHPSADPQAWSLIEKERGRDRFIRRVSVVAWSVTFLIAIVFTIMVGGQVMEMYRLGVVTGPLSFTSVVGMLMPLVIVLGFLSVLIATLSTVGMFLRFRTASLTEIQLRLAALEAMLSGAPEGKR